MVAVVPVPVVVPMRALGGRAGRRGDARHHPDGPADSDHLYPTDQPDRRPHTPFDRERGGRVFGPGKTFLQTSSPVTRTYVEKCST